MAIVCSAQLLLFIRVFNYGRYSEVWGLGGGEGQLRIWSDFNKCKLNQIALGRKTQGYVYKNELEGDQEVISYYKNLIEGIAPNRTFDGFMKQYRKDDYHAANNNCTTVALDGLGVGVPADLFNAINNADNNEGRGLSFAQRLAYRAAYDGDGVSMPLDLQEAIKAQGEYMDDNVY